MDEQEQKFLQNSLVLGREKSLNRIITLKLKAYEYEIVLAREIDIGGENNSPYGFTGSYQGCDIVINNDIPKKEQMVTLIHEVLHFIYKYAEEEEVEEAGIRLYEHLTEDQFNFLYAYLELLPIWKSSRRRKLLDVN